MEDTTPSGGEPAAQTHYDALGISPDASQDRVHRAYSSLLAEFRDNPTPEMEERVRRARIAHKVLSDPQTRAFYNADLKLSEAPQRKWEYKVENQEEKSLAFWAVVAALPISPLISYLFLKGLFRLPIALSRAVGALLSRKRPPEKAQEQ